MIDSLKRFVSILIILAILFVVSNIWDILPYITKIDKIPFVAIIIFQGFLAAIAALWIFEPLARINAGKEGKPSPWLLFLALIVAVLIGDYFSPLITTAASFFMVIFGACFASNKNEKYMTQEKAKKYFEKAFRATYDEQKLREGFAKAKQEGKEITKEEIHAVFESARKTDIPNNPKGINDYIVNPQSTIKKDKYVLRCPKCNDKIDPDTKLCMTCRKVVEENEIVVSNE